MADLYNTYCACRWTLHKHIFIGKCKAEGEIAPLNAAINQLAGENQYSPPSLAGWRHSGVIKIVTIDKSRWMEHFLLAQREKVIVFVQPINTPDGLAHLFELHPEAAYRRWWDEDQAKVMVHLCIHFVTTIITGPFSLSRLLRVLSDLVMCKVYPGIWWSRC